MLENSCVQLLYYCEVDVVDAVTVRYKTAVFLMQSQEFTARGRCSDEGSRSIRLSMSWRVQYTLLTMHSGRDVMISYYCPSLSSCPHLGRCARTPRDPRHETLKSKVPQKDRVCKTWHLRQLVPLLNI